MQIQKLFRPYYFLAPYFRRICRPFYCNSVEIEAIIPSYIFFYLHLMNKDLADTNAFGPSSVDDLLYELDLENSYLDRFKAQREKIQQIAKLYCEKEVILESQLLKNRELAQENERLRGLSHFETRYEDLRKDFDQLSRLIQTTEAERDFSKRLIESQKGEFTSTITSLKEEIKILNSKIQAQKRDWEDIVFDKEEELQRTVRELQEGHYRLTEELKKSKKESEEIMEKLEQSEQQRKCDRDYFVEEINIREQDLANIEKIVDSMKRQSIEDKRQIQELTVEAQRGREGSESTMQQLLVQLRTFKLERKDREKVFYDLKEQLRRSEAHAATCEADIDKLKSALKQAKDSSSQTQRRMTQVTNNEKLYLQSLIAELRTTVDEIMLQKETEANENKKLRTIIERKTHHERERKLLLLSEFREIDKLEKIVKRIS